MHCAPRPKERFPRVGAAREGRVRESSGTRPRPRLTHAQLEHLQHLWRGLTRQRLQVDLCGNQPVSQVILGVIARDLCQLHAIELP